MTTAWMASTIMSNLASRPRWPKGTLGFALVQLAGCVSIIQHPLQMTYHSDPEGATLYQGTTRLGYTPITLTYQDISYIFRSGNCIALQPVQIRWASGAAATVTNLKGCPAQGYRQQYSILRPTNAPGADIDANFAVQLQRNGILEQQADAQDAIAVSQFIRPRQSEP